jgi:hypothetical protein
MVLSVLKEPRLGERCPRCDAMGIAPPALAPYAGQLCSCLRQCLDTDHLHTCPQHSGNWQGAHELFLTAIADIAHDAGFRTNRGSRVPTSRGQRRGDLEIKGLNVAGTPDLVRALSWDHPGQHYHLSLSLYTVTWVKPEGPLEQWSGRGPRI